MKRWYGQPWVMVLTLLLAFQAVGLLVGQTKRRARRRARRPSFSQVEVQRTFYADVFSELSGERPQNLASASSGNAGGNTPIAPGGAGGGEPAAKGAWAAVISSTTIEDEIKAIKMQVDKDVTTPSAFAGRGYKACRLHFTMLAALFGAVNEYDDDIRWKKPARAARDLFARTAANANFGTPQVYNEAKLRKQELQDLIGGSNVESTPKPEPPTWGDLVDRSPIMQRLEIGVNERLKPWTASKSEFMKNNEKVFHEAELLAFLSMLLTKESMEDGDDEDYAEFAKKMFKAGRDTVEGVKLNDYERARKAVGAASQACDECHELYRA